MVPGDKLNLSELLSLLQSNDCDVDEIKALIHDHLKQTKDSSQLNTVLDFYFSTGHHRLQEIVIGIREPHDKHLFNKLNDCLKKRLQLKALTLLGHIIHCHPPWLPNISSHAVLQTLIKMLQTDRDVQNLACGVLVLVSLLPVIPSLVGPFLSAIFASFTRLVSFHTRNPPNIPEVHIMHLHVATYTLFHRLYSLYPCHFIAYLRNYFKNRDHMAYFADTVRPMLERVRMHPSLIISTPDSELALTRWRSMETQDIIMECAKVSLDPSEGLREEQVTVGILNTALQKLKMSYKTDLVPNVAATAGHLPVFPSHSDSILGQEPQPGWSPSYACGLNTPPPSEQSSPPGGYLGAEYLARFSSGAEARNAAVLDPVVPGEGGAEPVVMTRRGLEREDSIVDPEVATLTAHPPDHHRPLVQRSPSVRGSGQWNQSPYLELLQQQDSHRGRSFSQGKRGPRYVPPRRPSMLVSRSHSLPDLRDDLQQPGRHGDRLPVALVTAPDEPSAEDGEEGGLDASEEAVAPLPFQQLLEMVMPEATGRAADERQVVAKPPLFVHMSPSEMLDRYLFNCGNLHHLRAQARDTVETATGGAPAASTSSTLRPSNQQSEVDILRGQIQLLHTQLLYERHKREMHAARNRHLLGKAKQAKALDEKNRALENQVAQLARDNANLTATAASVRRERHETVEAKNGELATAREALSRVTKENVVLVQTNEELTFKLKETTAELRDMEKSLRKVQADLFGTHHELQVIQEQVSINGQLRSEIEKLNRELICVLELNARYQERENAVPEHKVYDSDYQRLLQTAQHEIRFLRVALQTRDAVVSTCRSRVTDLEETLRQRDIKFAKQKQLQHSTAVAHQLDLEAAERKYDARGKVCHVCQDLEARIVKMNYYIQRIEDINRTRMINEEQREQVERNRVARVPPPPIRTSPEQALLVHQRDLDQVSYFDDAPEELRNRIRERLPSEGTVRRTSQPIDIDQNNPVSRARRMSASKTKKSSKAAVEEGGAVDGAVEGAVGGAAGGAVDVSISGSDGSSLGGSQRTPAEMDSYGGFGDLPVKDLEHRRRYLRGDNAPSVLENVSARSLASMVDEVEENSARRAAQQPRRSKTPPRSSTRSPP